MAAETQTKEICELKHKTVDENVAEIWKKLNAMDYRLWVLLAGVFGILLALVVK